jgi:hypothetical protein
MRKKWMFFLIPPAIVLFVAIFGEVVMHLWNWLAPALFGWHMITFWQALGLLVLCRILFGGFGSHGRHHRNGRRQMYERWENMSPEEREKLRQGFRGRCGNFGPRGNQPTEPA